MRKIKEKAARLRRFPRGRGFGVQSPNDYNFITKVVKGHIDSGCCSETDGICDDVHGDNYKFAHLCYRVAQYLKPSLCMCLMSENENVGSYVRSAVPDVEINGNAAFNDVKGRILLIISPIEKYTDYVDSIMKCVSDNVWVIADGIRSNSVTHKYWEQIAANERSRITFDLYHYGIICFDRKRYKQNYKIYL